jgi:hypothetical protein
MKWAALLSAMMFLLGMLGGGCLGDAPRSNPLDPLGGGDAESGGVAVLVTRYYSPFQGLGAADVRLDPVPSGSRTLGPSVMAQTDAAGRFTARGLDAGAYVVWADKAGYAPGFDTVAVVPGQVTSVEVRLGGLPLIEDRRLTTTHVSRWWPTNDLYLLEVAVRVRDLDGPGDVRQAWVEVPSLAFSDTLLAGQGLGLFAKSISAAEMGLASLQPLLGRALVVKARDQAGFEHAAAPLQLARVIEETPVAAEPQGLAELDDPTPVLRWQRTPLPYPFTYRVDIVRVETNIQTTVQVLPSLAAAQDSVVVPTPLSPGSYFWTISVVDEFGNRSRSKEAGFVIQ